MLSAISGAPIIAHPYVIPISDHFKSWSNVWEMNDPSRSTTQQAMLEKHDWGTWLCKLFVLDPKHV
jgi:hypothetical protein